jgi:hypothetical protein
MVSSKDDAEAPGQLPDWFRGQKKVTC